jgi:Pentapeptide repeats (8 copies)
MFSDERSMHLSNVRERLHVIENVWFAAVVALLLLLILVVLVFFVLPALLVTADDVPLASQRLKLQNDVRTTGVQVLGGLVLALGAFFTARTIQVNKEAQITDRFSRAIDQLGRDELDVQLGGIYALERIARDSKRDHGPIVEVLTAYLRHRSQERAAPPVREPVYAADVPRRITADLQAVLTVLARRKTANERRHGGMTLDLLGADLRDAVFFGNFDRAILRSADLRGAEFHKIGLRDANFEWTQLQEATFDRADLRGADFQGAHLEGARFDHSDLTLAKSLVDVYWDWRTEWCPNDFRPPSNPVPVNNGWVWRRNEPLVIAVGGLIPETQVWLEAGGTSSSCKWEVIEHGKIAVSLDSDTVAAGRVCVLISNPSPAGGESRSDITFSNPSPAGGESRSDITV